MATEPARDVREDFVPVFELDRERRRREDLFDRPENFDGALFVGLLRRLLAVSTRRARLYEPRDAMTAPVSTAFT